MTEAIERAIIEIINRYWTFDESQQHTHSWHDKQDCLDKLRASLRPLLCEAATNMMASEARKAKLFDLLNDPLLKHDKKNGDAQLHYYVQDIFGFEFFLGTKTLDEVIEEIEWMLNNEREQAAKRATTQ